MEGVVSFDRFFYQPSISLMSSSVTPPSSDDSGISSEPAPDAAEGSATADSPAGSSEDTGREPGVPQLPDSHVLSGFMIPHHSDGSTEVLVRGRDDEGADFLKSPDDNPTEEFSPTEEAAEDVVEESEESADETAFESNESDEEQDVQGEDEAAPIADEAASNENESIHGDSFLGATEEPSDASAEETAEDSPAEESTGEGTAEEAGGLGSLDLPLVVGAGAAAARPRSSAAKSAASGEPQKGNLLVLILVSYASAVTLALVYLLMRGLNAEPPMHQLESLPDPVDEKGTVRIIERGAELPFGHTLELASKQRFGNIVVEPLRLTRGPVEFVHFTGDKRHKHPPSEPVVKLWLRLTNVSKDQEIAPFDAQLLYQRAMNRAGVLVANNFIRRSDQPPTGPVVYAYPASQHSEWDMRDQHLGHVLKPGESMELFIPSDWEGLDQLEGPLQWRLHMRKGYSPKGRGVTTLVDVVFNSNDIRSETDEAEPAAEKETPKAKPEPKAVSLAG